MIIQQSAHLTEMTLELPDFGVFGPCNSGESIKGKNHHETAAENTKIIKITTPRTKVVIWMKNFFVVSYPYTFSTYSIVINSVCRHF